MLQKSHAWHLNENRAKGTVISERLLKLKIWVKIRTFSNGGMAVKNLEIFQVSSPGPMF